MALTAMVLPGLSVFSRVIAEPARCHRRCASDAVPSSGSDSGLRSKRLRDFVTKIAHAQEDPAQSSSFELQHLRLLIGICRSRGLNLARVSNRPRRPQRLKSERAVGGMALSRACVHVVLNSDHRVLCHHRFHTSESFSCADQPLVLVRTVSIASCRTISYRSRVSHETTRS